MIININSKEYNARYNVDGELIVKLDNIEDVLFFNIWCDETKNNSKSEYIRDVRYEKIGESGILKHCFPIMDMNQEYIKLIYDRILFDK